MYCPPDKLVLDYAGRLGWFRRRRLRAIACACIILMILGLSGIHYWQPATRTWMLIKFQHQCLYFTRPPDKIAAIYSDSRYSGDADIAFVVGRDQQYVVHKGNWGGFAAYSALPYDDLVSILDDSDRRIPVPNSAERIPVLFLHGRKNKAGREMLVVVRIRYSRSKQAYWALSTEVYARGLMEPRRCKRSTDDEFVLTDFYEESHAFTKVQFFFGQPDPQDSARFTISYEMDSMRGTIVGILNNDDTVDLKPIDGAAVKYPSCCWMKSAKHESKNSTLRSN